MVLKLKNLCYEEITKRFVGKEVEEGLEYVSIFLFRENLRNRAGPK